MVAFSQGILTVNSNLIVNADDAIVARGDAIVKINEDGTHTTKLDGNIDFNYDKKTSGTKVDADVLVNLTGADSYWNGNAKVSWGTGEITPEEKAQVTGLNLILAEGAQWNPTVVNDYNTGDSGVTSIAINQLTANEGVINVKDGAKARIGEMLGTGADVNVETLAEAQVEIATKSADTKLRVNAGSDITDQLANGEASVDETAKIVAFSADSESTDYQFTSAESDVAGAMSLQVEDGQVVAGSVKEAANTSNAGISNMGAIALMTWRQENNDMNKRLGELRDSAGEHGVWVRMTRGEGKYKSIKNQYNSYQIGYDEKLSVNKNWTVGAALTYTDGESSFAQGNGENTHKGLALYGSYLNDDGSFIDLIAKYSRLEHEFDTIGGAGKGDYETNGYSLSAEYGKRFTKDNGLWIEPQVELTYGKVGSADYLTSNGVKVRQDGMDSLVGRLGFALGKDLAKDKGNVYLRASYLYDFDGETDMRFSKGGVSRTMEQDLGGGWWEVGVGANINLSAASHLYVDVEKTYGGDVATPWQWNAGVRWSF
ncbi:MAG: autotransporter outer membrane beta-barrel domain-containing protein [Phascolarctobacterium sp.]|uniref:autotransporter outer membrane beta-barrel domain-containing protein n=1 Tax=Phascolarctobacterium sp. TaxID=2049039 RepID=UPI0026DB93C7|nr:autotransporter outer membrane beta-barrel domain-containing protein [Phascolarctobacterium sp.]MDO4921158.1 autotransporter outer membrane beta-barrel domain-containing protein [Phascolarctobacterium sp.]